LVNLHPTEMVAALEGKMVEIDPSDDEIGKILAV
jgi:hypothetical protein